MRRSEKNIIEYHHANIPLISFFPGKQLHRMAVAYLSITATRHERYDTHLEVCFLNIIPFDNFSN